MTLARIIVAGTCLSFLQLIAVGQSFAPAPHPPTSSRTGTRGVLDTLRHGYSIAKHVRAVCDAIHEGTEPPAPAISLVAAGSVLKLLDAAIQDLDSIEAPDATIPESAMLDLEALSSSPTRMSGISTAIPALRLLVDELQLDMEAANHLTEAGSIAEKVAEVARDLKDRFVDLMGVPVPGFRNHFGFSALDMDIHFIPKINAFRSASKKKADAFRSVLSGKKIALGNLVSNYLQITVAEHQRLESSQKEQAATAEWLSVRMKELDEEKVWLQQLYTNLVERRAQLEVARARKKALIQSRDKANDHAQAADRDLNAIGEYRSCPNGHPYSRCNHPQLKSDYDDKVNAKRSAVKYWHQQSAKREQEANQTEAHIKGLEDGIDADSVKYNNRRQRCIEVQAEVHTRKERLRQLINQALADWQVRQEVASSLPALQALADTLNK